jgi:hypothetical protein
LRRFKPVTPPELAASRAAIDTLSGKVRCPKNVGSYVAGLDEVLS